MNIKIISVIITLFVLSISLFGCGVSSPTGANGFGSPAAGIPGPSGISFSAVFPTRSTTTATGINALISASTATIKISIHDSAGNILNNSSVTPASPSIMIPVTGYTGSVKVYITSYDSAGNITASHIHDASIYANMTTPISVALVEFSQGVAGIAGVTLRAPDYSLYTLTDLFLASSGTSYQLGIKANKAVAAGFHLSTQNVDQTTPNGTNPPNTQLFVLNDTLSFPIDVPNASKTVWNRYQININFMNGAGQGGTIIPTNTPNITGTFVGAFSAPGVSVPIATSLGFIGVTWSGTQFVAVGSDMATGVGGIMTSPDGVTWTPRTIPTPNPINAIAWSGTQFVAVGGAPGTVITSPDGITWTLRTSPTVNTLNSVTWSPTKLLFVTVDSFGFIFTSPDGITWTQQVSPVANAFGLLEVIWSPTHSLFVTVGAGGKIVTSPDGITWTVQPSATTAILRAVTLSPTLGQLAVVGDGAILTSANGTAWTVRTSPTIASIKSVTWSGTKFIAVGLQDMIITSPDGITWTLGSSGLTTLSFWGITTSPTKGVVVVGDWGTIINTANSGVSWTGNAQGGTGFSLPNAAWAAYTLPTLPLAPASIIF